METIIKRLQDNLSLIRLCAGWSSSELGKRLGVSRQMISNLENGRNKMTRMQYLAIRRVLDDEIKSSSGTDDTQMLKDVISVLVDDSDRYTEEQKKKVISDANMIAPSIASKKTTRENASETWKVLAGSIVAVSASILALTSITKDDKKEKGGTRQ